MTLDRLRRLGDDEPGLTVWTLPAYHALYAPMTEVDAVSAWFAANEITYVSGCHEVRVEQRASRLAAVYEAVCRPWAQGRSLETETRVVTLTTGLPVITTPARPDLHELLEMHWPATFPLIDFGAAAACGHCTREARATLAADMVHWPCPVVAAAMDNPPQDPEARYGPPGRHAVGGRRRA